MIRFTFIEFKFYIYLGSNCRVSKQIILRYYSQESEIKASGTSELRKRLQIDVPFSTSKIFVMEESEDTELLEVALQVIGSASTIKQVSALVQ